MIEIVCHCGDIHIMKDSRHEEYRKVFEEFYKKLKEIKPDRIVVNGDIWNDWTDIRSEGFILLGEFLNNLSNISKTIITLGNHDYSRKNLNKIDTIKSITTILKNNNIVYYDKTGFYEDDNVIWSVWGHADRGNPWKKFPIEKDKSKTYIDLYHDPIENVKLYNGTTLDKKGLPTIKDFLGDISMLNDIHLFQHFENGKKAFSSSLIQQNFGEGIDNHGFLRWSIKNKSFEFIELINDHNFIKFQILPGVDYDHLKLNTKSIAKNKEFKIDWNDYAPNINNENENKIIKHIKNKYGENNYLEIKKFPIYSDLKDSKMLSEVIDVNNKHTQQKLIKEYLKENKFSEEFIEKIIEIDDIINSRIKINSVNNIVWNIDKFWFNNFKGYGDDNVIDWENTNNAVIQISGFNQMGKTTILDAICFILYGTTTSTQKAEKNGNSRYINKYRKLDFCDGGAVIDVNGEKYTMYRRVDRNSGKRGEIKSCPMTLEYYKGPEMVDDKKQTDENKIQTQRLLDSVLGDFQDFVRMSLTNADNLNSLLSMDKSVFIDGVIRDAGYDIFEKKLDEFKEWKKSLNLEKINLNETQTESEILKLKGELEDNETYLKDIELELSDLEEELNKNNSKKENLLRTLHKIDNIQVDIDSVKYSITYLEGKLNKNAVDVINIEEGIEDLPETFDNNKFELYTKNYERFTTEKNKRNLELLETKSKIDHINNLSENVDANIEREKQIYINRIEVEIKNAENDFNNSVNEVENTYKYDLSKIENKTTLIKNEISNIKIDGVKMKNEISSYENMLNDDKATCPTCNQLIVNHDVDHVNGLISNRNEKLKELLKKGKSKLILIEEIEKEKENLFIERSKQISQFESDYIEMITTLKDKIDNFNLDFIKDKIDTIIKERDVALSEITNLNSKMDENSKFLKRADVEIEKVYVEITEMKKNKILYDKRKEFEHKRDNLISEAKDVQKTLDENKKSLEEFEKNKTLIKENEETNKSIVEVDSVLKELKSKSSNMNNDKMSYSNQIVLYKKVIEDLETKLKLYKEQILIEELHDVYLKLVHRSGLPTYLLTKNIDLLNKELSNLLTNTNFNLFFDEELNLKLQHDGRVGEINVIETSGMERTFSAIVLKIVLRIINFKSKSNIMFFDEIINRLVGKSVGKFLELLEVLKEKIDKIIIIEHNNEIQSDLIISVTKNTDGISVFELI